MIDFSEKIRAITQKKNNTIKKASPKPKQFIDFSEKIRKIVNKKVGYQTNYKIEKIEYRKIDIQTQLRFHYNILVTRYKNTEKFLDNEIIPNHLKESHTGQFKRLTSEIKEMIQTIEGYTDKQAIEGFEIEEETLSILNKYYLVDKDNSFPY